MLYFDTNDILNMGIAWEALISSVEKAVRCVYEEDFSQPVKPYLRYRNPTNRIICMPAYLGGETNIAGIKWIASFPENIKKGMPRAHSIVVLNDADTGKPVCIINSGVLSAIRTAAVSGLMIRYFEQVRQLNDVIVGIIGWGPIGQFHFHMCSEVLGNKIKEFKIFDIDSRFRQRAPSTDKSRKWTAVDSWQEAYENADVFITCTASKDRYINLAPKEGSLHLNVSLRDYEPDIYHHVKSAIVVDNWEEVCRENTDIEVMHKQMGLQKSDTLSITDVVCCHALKELAPQQPLMFNPMGMAVFDMAIAACHMRRALEEKRGRAFETEELTADDLRKVMQ